MCVCFGNFCSNVYQKIITHQIWHKQISILTFKIQNAFDSNFVFSKHTYIYANEYYSLEKRVSMSIITLKAEKGLQDYFKPAFLILTYIRLSILTFKIQNAFGF